MTVEGFGMPSRQLVGRIPARTYRRMPGLRTRPGIIQPNAHKGFRAIRSHAGVPAPA